MADTDTVESGAIEAQLVSEGVVTTAQLERARRIVERLETPRRLVDVLMELGQLSRTDYERALRAFRSRLTLAEILHEDGALDAAGLQRFRAAKAADPRRSDRDILLRETLVEEERYLQALSAQHDIPILEPEPGLVDPALIARTSFPYLHRHRVLPMRIADGELMAVLADPLDAPLLIELEDIFRVPVRAFCAQERRIQDALRTLERVREGRAAETPTALEYREVHEIQGDDTSGEGAVHIVDYLILRAIQMRASDLHIEPTPDKVRVRARVDGVLQSLTSLPVGVGPSVISRIKVIAEVDIAERRLHQDGRVQVVAEGREVDIRVSTYAGVHGENVALRLLDRARGLVPLDELGFAPRVLATLRDDALRASSGLVLVTGPTGSGKTTTLYSFVDFINDASIKVITAEDPVEYVLDGAVQCSVNGKVGPTFADSLRAIVRQDPDVVVVGEIRDRETAGLAVESALTGHKVFSTFHTEDAVGSVVRLIEMAVEPFLIASTVSCIVAQRLVRRVCEHCRAPGEPSREDLRFLGLDRTELAGAVLVRGAGCPQCQGTGFRGRVGIHEVLMPDDDFKDAIMRRVPSRDLRELARRLPTFLTLQESGLLKAMEGVTTLDEVVTNAPRDGAARRPSALLEIAGDRRLL